MNFCIHIRTYVCTYVRTCVWLYEIKMSYLSNSTSTINIISHHSEDKSQDCCWEKKGGRDQVTKIFIDDKNDQIIIMFINKIIIMSINKIIITFIHKIFITNNFYFYFWYFFAHNNLCVCSINNFSCNEIFTPNITDLWSKFIYFIINAAILIVSFVVVITTFILWWY